MSKNIVICGAGKMGMAVGWAMKKLGYYHLAVLDINPEHSNDFSKQFHGPSCCPVYTKPEEIPTTTDLVISSLPYFANLPVAKYCIDNKLRYCDLGGSVAVSKEINEYANLKAASQVPVMTDLGLAPGWVNIIAEECYQQITKEGMTVDNVQMMVGGIPVDPKINPLQYSLTWSWEGLLNEYLADCIILQNGVKTTVPGMSGLEDICINNRDLEAFYTSGASSFSIATMQQRGVQNCSYKTIRWRGHRDLVHFLIKDCQLSGGVIKQIFDSCTMTAEDMVLIDVSVVVVQGKKKDCCRITKEIKGTKDFSAMQRCTAFALAAVADLLAKGELDHLKTPAYCDVPFANFNQNLITLGLVS